MDIKGILSVIVAALTVVAFVICLLKRCRIKNASLYWIVCLIGAILEIFININNIGAIFNPIIKNSSLNPIKILIFFLSMTIMSLILDKLNFFEYIAIKCSKLAKGSQIKLFTIFYIVVSILTIFTSNDVVILSFIPFICYFCKSSNLNPEPYVFSTFTAANTWSMLFVIGNPTNVYLGTFANIDFVSYFLVMAIPTIVCGLLSYFLLLLLFRKSLKKPITNNQINEISLNKPIVILNALILFICIIILAISSYLNLEMWYIALTFVCLMIIVNLCIVKKVNKEKSYLKESLISAPWEFVPFLISMFLIVMCLNVNGITEMMAKWLSKTNTIFGYGLASFFASNLFNNIPMTTLFASIISNDLSIKAIYASIIGSNIGAIFSPVGALAGIMFLNILKEKNVDFSATKFIKFGCLIAIISIIIALTMLLLIM